MQRLASLGAVRAAALRRATLAQGSRGFVTGAAEASSSEARVFLGAAFGVAAAAAAAATALANPPQRPARAEERGSYLADLERRVRELEVGQAERTSAAFVFIKPHAVTDKVKALVAERFASEGIGVLSEGTIAAEQIDKEMLIDTHYGAIAARAMRQKPSELAVQEAAQAEFEKAFGLPWSEALQKDLVFNLADGAAKLGISMDELGDRFDKLKKGVDMLKFGGGFYCGKVDGIYVINGFYARMRSQFTQPGTSIYYYEVQWDPNRLSWGDFRGRVLGATDPKAADPTSLRSAILKDWQALGLQAEPNTGNNGMHASASPFEALAERANWLGMPLEADFYGKAMLSLAIPLATMKAWCDDPAVQYDGRRQSLFDLLEDLDPRACLRKSVAIFAGK
mmetsp:Transcript_122281/g.351274  ORF Transcript_122281/g.351274 Transcript_122281/m.351274 type:complete len:396 (+) Transcript_122281:65-1252(+)